MLDMFGSLLWWKKEERTLGQTVAESRLALAGVMLALSLIIAQNAAAFEIADDQQIDGEAPQIVGVGAGNTIQPAGENPNWTYHWGDRDGDGAGNAVAQAGLDLGAYKLYTDVTDSRGTITLDLNGGDLVGTGEIAVITSPGTGSAQSDHLTIRNVRDMAVGQILTYARGTSAGRGSEAVAGNLTIGSDADPARHLRIAAIHTGDHTVGTRSGVRRGDVVVYATGNVLIEDGDGNPGDIRTHACAEPDIAGRADPGHVSIAHDGAFRVNDIIAHMSTYSARKNPAEIVLDGGSGNGDCTIRDIDNRHYASGYGSSERGHVSIRNYANVAVRNIDSSHPFTDARMGGHVDIVNIANHIEITGTIDCSSGHSHVRVRRDHGRLKLSAGGKITLAELDLDKVQYAELSSGDGETVIQGELANFDPTATGGGGTEGDPRITTQTVLRVPADQKVFYDFATTPNLGGRVYRVADVEGQPGRGGLLMPNPDSALIMAREPRENGEGKAVLPARLLSTGRSPATVSVYWAEGGDRGTDREAWTHTQSWDEHDGELPMEYAHDIAVQPETSYTYRFAVRNAEGEMWTPPKGVARVARIFDIESIRVARWRNDADAAVSFTWDDNQASHRAIATIFNEYDWHATFVVNPGLKESWEPLKDNYAAMSREGHEIGNHSYRHRLGGASEQIVSEVEKANEAIEALTGVFPASFVHPHNARCERRDRIVFERHLVARVSSPYGMDGRVIHNDPGSLRRFQRDLDRIAKPGTADSGGWLITGGHGMDGDGYKPIQEDQLRAILDHLKARPETLWVGTMGEVGVYESAFKTVSVTVDYSYDALTIRPIGFDPEKFARVPEVPLTVTVPLLAPLDMSRLRLKPDDVSVRKDDGRLLITFDLKKTDALTLTLH